MLLTIGKPALDVWSVNGCAAFSQRHPGARGRRMHGLRMHRLWGQPVSLRNSSVWWLGFILIAAWCMLAGIAAAQTPEKRVALVVGAGKYSVKPLNNSVNDARAVGASLRKAGFEVTEVFDPDRSTFLKARTAFTAKADGADAAVIYFAGHGVELAGKNYLLPIDVDGQTDETLKDTSIEAASLKEALSGARLVRYLILDACRDNPFASNRSLAANRGLAAEQPRSASGEGVGILFATSTGDVAADGSGAANSPFAASLSRRILEPGLRLASLPGRIASDVKAATNRDQFPDYHGILENAEDWAFIPGTDAVSRERAAWRACENAVTGGPCQSYLASFPNGLFAETASVRLRDINSGVKPRATSAQPNVSEWVDVLGIAVSPGEAPGSILVGKILPKSPAELQLQPNDLIIKVNDALPDPALTPKQILEAAVTDTGRAKLVIQRGKVTTLLVLKPSGG